MALTPLPPPRPPAGGSLTLASAAAANAAPAAIAGTSVLQVGTFRDAALAYRYREALSRHGQVAIDPVNVSGITLYQVRVGPIRDPRAAEAALRDAHAQGATGARLMQGG